MRGRPKIAIVGGGNVGSTCALRAATKALGDVVVVDIPDAEGMVKGRMLDLAEAGPVERADVQVVGTTDYSDIDGADVVVITAGIPRKPGMSRDDLIKTNVSIVRSVSEKVKEHAPEAVVVVVSNPLDAMVYTAWRATGFPTHRIVGQAGCLDVARFKAFLAMETGFSVEDINALLLGGHGDDMVPLPRFTNVSGIPITQFIDKDRLDAIVERAKKGGGEIVQLMGTSAYYAPASGVIQMVEAIVRDKKRVLPCAGYCDGEFGINGYFVGVPCLLGADGVERVVEIDLNEEEKAKLHTSATHVAELVDTVKQVAPDLG